VITNNNQPHPDLHLNKVTLEKVSTYTQLGLVLNNRLTWDDHINSAVTKANKKMGLIWRLRNEMPRYITETIYTHYIRPQLEYGSIIYNDCTQEQSHRLESCQRLAAIACTGAYRRTNTDALLQEVGWPKLQTRRDYNSLVMLYKMTHKMTPLYLQNLLPPRQGQHHQSRYADTYIPIRARTERYNKSIIPATIRKWNALDTSIRTSPTISSFKRNLQREMFSTRLDHISKVRGRASIAHTRLRLGLSPLKQHLYAHGIMPSSLCIQCNSGAEETTRHYLLQCPKYAECRHDLLSNLLPVIGGLNININDTSNFTKLLLNGSANLSSENNTTLFKLVETYIRNTKRF